MKQVVTLQVNGEAHDLLIEPHRTLIEVLREQLLLTGTKKACDLGDCGSCTVLVDSEPILSCLTLALNCQEKEIVTIEGLAHGQTLHPLQRTMVEYGGTQCGFCTPGMILVAKPFLEENPQPSEAEVRQAISGNLCRCTGYVKIIEAILAAARDHQEEVRTWNSTRP